MFCFDLSNKKSEGRITKPFQAGLVFAKKTQKLIRSGSSGRPVYRKKSFSFLR
jgi:hypothetical protein